MNAFIITLAPAIAALAVPLAVVARGIRRQEHAGLGSQDAGLCAALTRRLLALCGTLPPTQPGATVSGARQPADGPGRSQATRPDPAVPAGGRSVPVSPVPASPAPGGATSGRATSDSPADAGGPAPARAPRGAGPSRRRASGPCAVTLAASGRTALAAGARP